MRHMRVNDSVGDQEEAHRCQPSADSLQPFAEKPAQKPLSSAHWCQGTRGMAYGDQTP